MLLFFLNTLTDSLLILIEIKRCSQDGNCACPEICKAIEKSFLQKLLPFLQAIISHRLCAVLALSFGLQGSFERVSDPKCKKIEESVTPCWLSLYSASERYMN